MPIPKHFQLVKEHPQSYEIHDTRDQRKFHIAKSGLNLAMHGELSKIQHFDEGDTNVQPLPPVPDAVNNPITLAANNDAPFSMGNMSAAINPVAGLPDKVETESNLIPDVQSSDVPSGLQKEQVTPINQPPILDQPSESAGSSPGQSDALSAQALNSNKTLQTEQDAIVAGAKAEGVQANRTAASQKQLVEDLADVEMPDEVLKRKQAQDDALGKAFNDKTIDQNRVFHNMGTVQKIGSTIGLIFGGFADGLAGRTNQTLESINGMIDRDIDAQKNAQGQALNTWKMFRDQTGNEIQANLSTRNALLTSAQAQALQYANEAGGDVAKARVAPLVAQIQHEKDLNNFRWTVLQTGKGNNGVSTLDPASLISSVPADKQGAVIKDIDEAATLANGKRQALDTFDQLQKIDTAENWAKNPVQTKRLVDGLKQNAGVVLAKSLAGRINEKEMAAGLAGFGGTGTNAVTASLLRKNLENLYDAHAIPGTAFKAATGMDLDSFSKTSLKPHIPAAEQQLKSGQINWVKQNLRNPNPQVQAQINFVRQKYGI